MSTSELDLHSHFQPAPFFFNESLTLELVYFELNLSSFARPNSTRSSYYWPARVRAFINDTQPEDVQTQFANSTDDDLMVFVLSTMIIKYGPDQFPDRYACERAHVLKSEQIEIDFEV
jgi:hypothetical protein